MMKEKTPLLDFWVINDLFLKNYVTSEGVVSHNILNYQQLSNARYQVGFQDNICFWVITKRVPSL